MSSGDALPSTRSAVASAAPQAAGSHDGPLAGGGEMGALMRSIDWSKTPVGPVERWPQSLRTALSILLETGFPMYIAWGPEFTQFYNDGYRPILGSTKHPAAMGISTRETFAEIWNIIGPMFEGVMAGKSVSVIDFLLPLDRHGFSEECYFIFSYSPIREESGRVGGVLVTVTETTGRVLGARRLKMLQTLATLTQGAQTVPDAAQAAMRALDENPADLPFAALYLLDPEKTKAHLAARSSRAGAIGGPAVVSLDDRAAQWPIGQCVATGGVLVSGRHGGEGTPVSEALARTPGQVVVLPVAQAGDDRPVGVLVCGTSATLALDDDYLSFLRLAAGQIGTALVNARALVEAKARAEALAELDRAKTTFFSNVSHEFRTPLTLMLGPLSDALSSPSRALAGEDLAAVHRNSLRLLKLVNSLLDFARIEAGRVQAVFEPVELDVFTRELASTFQSATDRAGLRLVAACEPLGEPAFVDRDLWEKIVLNLLSNAFKHTLEGELRVGLARRGREAVLTVRDTGVGIAADELPRLFERFHRVQGAQARSFEGTGIGLALVQQLVKLHGGRVSVVSEVGRGSTFSVAIPLGSAHLPANRVEAPRPATARRPGASAYVEEALQWVGATGATATEVDHVLGVAGASSGLAGARVLVVDDNADMRAYLARILGASCDVTVAADGVEALELARASPPSLVLTDLMMPRLDGFGLLRALRELPATQHVPVVMLSARAGDEARLDGLRAGVDDYLVKPFSARELVSRLEVQLTRARLREVEAEQSRRLNRLFQSAPVGIAVLRGPRHVFESANADYVRAVGGRDVVGKTVAEAFPDLATQGIYELLDRVYTTGEPFVGRSVRLVLNEPSGPREAYFDFLYQPNRDARGDVDGILVVVFDVTELARARNAAESASRAKDEFLALLGHELRNPLAPIATALTLLQRRRLTGVDRELGVLDRQVRHLTRLVDDLLDVARVASGKVELKREVIELSSVVSRSVEQVRQLFESKRHTLRAEVPAGGLSVDGDSTRLAQVVTNLLVNAAKYTDPGGKVVVSATADGGDAVLRVRDDGVGIPEQLMPHVFDMFVQGRQSSDRALGGLGLGLTLVRNLVELHGGRVFATSKVGEGSEFVVRLPLAAERRPAALAPGAGAGPAKPLRVLVVDDNEDAAELLAMYLADLGLTPRVARDGEEALALVEELEPDVALLDLGLPGMDGYELGRRLRARPSKQALTIIAVSGYGQTSDVARAMAAGFDAHLVKPVDLDKLTGLLAARSR